MRNLPSREYGQDVLATPLPPRRSVPEVAATRGLVVEDVEGYVGEVVLAAKDAFTLEDRHGRRRLFRYGPGYLLEGRAVREGERVGQDAGDEAATCALLPPQGGVGLTEL